VQHQARWQLPVALSHTKLQMTAEICAPPAHLLCHQQTAFDVCPHSTLHTTFIAGSILLPSHQQNTQRARCTQDDTTPSFTLGSKTRGPSLTPLSVGQFSRVAATGLHMTSGDRNGWLPSRMFVRQACRALRPPILAAPSPLAHGPHGLCPTIPVSPPIPTPHALCHALPIHPHIGTAPLASTLTQAPCPPGRRSVRSGAGSLHHATEPAAPAGRQLSGWTLLLQHAIGQHQQLVTVHDRVNPASATRAGRGGGAEILKRQLSS